MVAAITARYWRLRMLEGGGTGQTISLAELNLYDASETLISKTGATVTASATWGGSETAPSAYDGNSATHWAGRTDTTGGVGWLQIDYGSDITVSGFGLVFRNELATIPGTAQLQYSADGSTWTDFSGVIRNKGVATTHSPPPVSGVEYRYGYDRRHWRLNITAYYTSGHNTGPGLQDIEFRTTAGVTELASGGRPYANGQWSDTQGAASAFDGNTATNWGKQDAPGIVGYRYPDKKQVSEVLIRARSVDLTHSPKDFTVEYSDDIGLTWTVVATRTNEPTWTALEERTFAVAGAPGVVQTSLDTSWDVAATTQTVNVTVDTSWNIEVVAVGHKHWRVRVDDTRTTGASTYTIFPELLMTDAPGGTQLATGGTATMSSTYSSNVASRAFNGSVSSTAETNDTGFPQWIAYEFPAPVDIRYIELTCGTYEPMERPTVGAIEYSDDGTTWTEAAPFNVTWETSGLETQILFGGPIIVALDTAWNVEAIFAVTQTLPVSWNVEQAAAQVVNAVIPTSWNVESIVPPVDLSRLIVPDYPVLELWTFQTSIFRSKSGREERRARITRPVITQQFTAPSFIPEDFQRTRRALEIDTEYFYPVPMFQYYAFLQQDAPAGSTRFYFSQSRTNVVVGQSVAFMSEGRETAIGVVDEVHSDGVTLTVPLNIDVDTDYSVCPVLFSRLSSNAVTNHSPVHAYTSFSYVSAERELDFVRPGNAVVLPTLGGVPLLARYIRANSAVTENLLSGNTIIDNARANPVVFAWEPTRRQFAITYKADRETAPESMDFWRQFFGTIRGQQKAFALPTYRPDAAPVAPILAGATEITLAGTDFADVWEQGGYIGLALGKGTRLVIETCHVVSVGVLAGNTVCELAAPVSGDGFDVVSFIMRVRCASDQVRLDHTDFETVLSFSVQMVKE